MDFIPYPKTPRLKRDVVITEKIDGTNAQIVITLEPRWRWPRGMFVASKFVDDQVAVMRVGSRSRWIAPGKFTDNFGFAAWCLANAEELFKLGEGTHFGEWYGQGIQRGYGLDHRRFALFNTARWGAHNPGTPKCCEVVPVFRGAGSLAEVDDVLAEFMTNGSMAVPGWPTPEGICVYHSASKQTFKVLIENDEMPKGLVEGLNASNPYSAGVPTS